MTAAMHGESQAGVGHAAGVAASFLLFICAAMAVFGLMFPWWTGPSAGTVIGEDTMRRGTITLWEYDATVLEQPTDSASGEPFERAETGNWDDRCDSDKTIKSNCETIFTMRAMLFIMIILSFTAIVLMYFGITKSPLAMVAGAFIAAIAALCGFIGLGLCAMLSFKSLSGTGLYIFGAAPFLAFTAAAMAIYGSHKLMVDALHQAEIEPWKAPRQDRAEQARDKARAEAEALENHLHSPEPAKEEEVDEEAPQRKAPVMLRKILYWNEENDADAEIPTYMLELAFREIDADMGGSIDTSELVTALRLCGLNASDAATDTVMKEIDKNASGDIDIHEFVEFFRTMEELHRFHKRSVARAQFLTFLCNFCFIFMIIVVITLIMVVIRMNREGKGGDNMMIITTVLHVCSAFLGILCLCVIAIPAGRLTAGPSIDMWVKQYEIQFAHRRKKKNVGGEPPPQGSKAGGWPGSEPQTVNAAMFGASYRSTKQQMNPQLTNAQFQESAVTPFPQDAIADSPQGAHTGTLRSSARVAQSHKPPPGAITDKAGQMLQYNPDAYRTAALRSMEQRPAMSFTPMQARDYECPENQPPGMLALGDYMA